MSSIRPVALCLVEHEGKFLLQDSDYAGIRLLRPPGGGIDFGEHAAEAVRREMQEEIGCDIREIELLAVLENPFKFKHLGTVWSGARPGFQKNNCWKEEIGCWNLPGCFR